MNHKIYIIIPVHNRKEFTRDCLLSLRAQTYKNFKTVIIDDGSTDGTAEMLANDFPEVHVIKGDGNLWWAAATNLGVKYALENNADYVLTLNNDTVATEDFLEKMIYWAEKTPNALLGAFAIYKDNNEPSYGGEIGSWKKVGAINLLKVVPYNERFGLKEVSHFPGRGLFIPSEVFKVIGFYDEIKFPQNAADDDFTFRASYLGYKIFCNYDAKIFVYRDKIKYSLKNYLQYLFGKSGKGNVIYFTKYAMRHSPKKYLLWALIKGNGARIFGYPIDWIKNIIKRRF